MKYIALFLTAFVLSACTSAPPAKNARTAVPENINTRFLDPDLDPEQWKNRWEVEAREIYASRHEIVEAIRLAPGESIADIGSGTGLFIAPFSQAVGPSGMVYAIDISPNFIEHLEQRTDAEGLDNVRVILSKEDSTELPANSVDAVFVCDTYHHFEYHRAMLSSIRTALRPGGRLILVDFERIPGVTEPWLLKHVRAGKETFVSEIEEAGFRFVEEVDVAGLEQNYFVWLAR